ncbi:MAG TPA: hypothetical protein VK827_08595, partial [Lysobacter sp.]|nr:hypothetical protein [Lysobacter sp.]
MRRRPSIVLVAIVGGALLGGACSPQDADLAERRPGATETAALPVPDAGRGGVTGMPGQPGPGAIGTPEPAPGPEIDDLLDSAAGLPGTPDDATSRDLHGEDPSMAVHELPQAPAEPGAEEAVATVRAYYDALDSGSYARAYRFWSDGGAATGQSPQQFADSFAGTAAQSVEFLTPGRIDAAAGSRYIEVPVMIEAIGRDGGVRR